MTHLRLDCVLLSRFLVYFWNLPSFQEKIGFYPGCDLLFSLFEPGLNAPFAYVKLAHVLPFFVELFPFSLVKPTDHDRLVFPFRGTPAPPGR